MMIVMILCLILSISAAAPLNSKAAEEDLVSDDIGSVNIMNGDYMDDNGIHSHSSQNTDRDARLVINAGDVSIGSISLSGDYARAKIAAVFSNVAYHDPHPVLRTSQDRVPAHDPGSFDECQFKTCGELCQTGVCDGHGFCVDPLENPCEQHGCEGKSCGDPCRAGDIVGNCDIDGNCDFDIDRAFNSCDKQEAPKQEGESCGSCFCPPTYSAGDCAEGLTCVTDERIPDAPGICTRPGGAVGVNKEDPAPIIEENVLRECIQLCQSDSCQKHKFPSLTRDGCNQMFSCAHGCKLRHLGVKREDCMLNHCDRNDQSGCHPKVNGWEFDLCKDCDRSGCGPQVVEECQKGCTFYKGDKSVPLLYEEPLQFGFALPNYEDGEWFTWSSWSDCIGTCGEATKTRTRECSSPPGGMSCPGAGTETESCGLPSCGDATPLFPCDFKDEDLTQCTEGLCIFDVHMRNPAYKWKKNIIPYYFTTTSEKDKDLYRSVMAIIKRKTCFEFQEKNKAEYENQHSLEIVTGSKSCATGCYGSVGRPYNSERLVLESITQVNDKKDCKLKCEGFVLHELMHVLGVEHTFNRRDRDDFVIMNYQNMPQFKICENCHLYPEIPYDCDSIMHYGTHMESRNGLVEVMKPKDGKMCGLKEQAKLVHGPIGSDLDWKLLNIIGNCPVCLTSPEFPENYASNSDVEQTLSVEAGLPMVITFHKFDIEASTQGDCPYDYLEFFDENSKPVGNKMCGESLPDTLTISTSSASAVFHSDYSVQKGGYMFCYLPVKCETSPKYPENYPGRQNYSQILMVETGPFIEITFYDFHLETEEECLYDYLEFLDEDSNPVSKKMCGKSLPPKITIPSSTAKAVFYSDASEERRGYKFCYTGAVADPVPIIKESGLWECIQLCQSYSCQKHKFPSLTRDGCNQMFSCAHGCKLRLLGVKREDCMLNHCERNDQSGCHPKVNDWEFDLCKDCDRSGCGPQVVEECQEGCTFYKEDKYTPGFKEKIRVDAKGTAVDFLHGTWNYHSLHEGRPAYKFENGGYYLFWLENRWMVETEIGRHTHESGGYPLFGYIRAEVDVPFPQNVGRRWMEPYSREIDPSILVV